MTYPPCLKEDIKTACKSAIKDLDRKKEESKIINDWIKTFDNEELTVGKYLAVDSAGDICFNDLGLIENFRKYYEDV